MKRGFYDELPLEKLIQIVHDLWAIGLLPGKEAFLRLQELENKGEEVEVALAEAMGLDGLAYYRRFKNPESATAANEDCYADAESAPAKPSSSRRSLRSVHPEDVEYLFMLILRSHMKYVPVFTRMHEAGYKELADGYRQYLFDRFPAATS